MSVEQVIRRPINKCWKPIDQFNLPVPSGHLPIAAGRRGSVGDGNICCCIFSARNGASWSAPCRGMALPIGLVDCWILDSLKPRLTRISPPWTCSRILLEDPLQPLSHPSDFRNRPLIIYSELHRTQGIVLILLRRRCEFWIRTSKPVTRRWTSEQSLVPGGERAKRLNYLLVPSKPSVRPKPYEA